MPFLALGQTVIGIDEVGRGAWAGPVVASAVVLPAKLDIESVNDSKVLSPALRALLDRRIRRSALSVGIGWVSPAEVDEFGLTWAVRESGLRALAGIPTDGAVVILDGKHNYLADTHRSEVFVGADASVVPVAAASIVAKVARDRYMVAMSRRLPGYGFEFHKGYGTKLHREGLKTRGPSHIHRMSYAPLRKAANVDD